MGGFCHPTRSQHVMNYILDEIWRSYRVWWTEILWIVDIIIILLLLTFYIIHIKFKSCHVLWYHSQNSRQLDVTHGCEHVLRCIGRDFLLHWKVAPYLVRNISHCWDGDLYYLFCLQIHLMLTQEENAWIWTDPSGETLDTFWCGYVCINI